MNNDKKLFTARAIERATQILQTNPALPRSMALKMAMQELTHYLVASVSARVGVYRATLGQAEIEAGTLRRAGNEDVMITPPRFDRALCQDEEV